ncbi:MAG: thioredoxin family protein [Synergistaceae bacterium]|jgi:thioredoxin-like negative regulator of GroEL|nr:thioredoxin family protein [Synergistaceae bacterium]
MWILLFAVCLLLVLNFLTAAQAENLPTLKVLSTPNCPNCAQMLRVLDEIDSKYGAKVATERVNLFEHRDVAKQYNVRYVPHLLFVDAAGNVVKQEIGAKSLEEVMSLFQEAGVNIA